MTRAERDRSNRSSSSLVSTGLVWRARAPYRSLDPPCWWQRCVSGGHSNVLAPRREALHPQPCRPHASRPSSRVPASAAPRRRRCTLAVSCFARINLRGWERSRQPPSSRAIGRAPM
eukprot:359869-Chlamydomonas_euryale.AAC.24